VPIRRTVLAAAATSLVSLSALSAQRVYRIGYLSLGAPPRGRVHDLDLKPLADLGWVEGKNITGEVRYAADGSDQLPQFAAQLVQLKVDIIATNGTDAALAAKNATSQMVALNLKTARALGVQIPHALLLRADLVLS
jgi:putative ABC transport system substrate-binding protein